MMVRDTEPFLFVAGTVPIDFVNTEIVRRGEPKDLLAGEDDLLRWMTASGLALPAQLRHLRRRFLPGVKALRADLRRTFLRLAEGQPLRASDVGGINDALAAGEQRLELTLRDGRPRLETKFHGSPSPLFLIARAAAEFLATADLSLVRQCEGAGCVLLFYDTTKSHTRRWCSMSACGNRSKAAAHYARITKSRR